VPVHPLEQLLLDHVRRADDDPLRVHLARPDERVEPPGHGRCDADLLLEQRLAEVLCGDADFPAQGQDLVLGERVADVPLTGLELGGALDDPLEGRAVDAGGKVGRHLLCRRPLRHRRLDLRQR
jgi:hypothetical protein